MRLEITEADGQKIANFLYEVDAAIVAKGRSDIEIGQHLFLALHWAANGKDAKETAVEVIAAHPSEIR